MSDTPFSLKAMRAEARPSALLKRLRELRTDSSDHGVTKRMASATFVLRVVNAGIAIISQVVLARWMGEHEYGIYAYAWVWVLLFGGLAALGLPAAAQRFIPEYTERGDFDRLRGFIRNGGLTTLAVASLLALCGAALLRAFGTAALEQYYHLPLYLALACVPLFALVEFQEGVARTYHWANLAFAPAFLVRPLMILAGLGVFYAAGFMPTANALMWISLAAMVVCGVGQFVILRERLRVIVPRGERVNEPRTWLNVAWPLFLLDGFYLMLTYTDVLILQRFHSPSDVANYFAATKLMAIMSFVTFAVTAASASRFAQYSISGDHRRLSEFMRVSAKWTFWPSLGAAIVLLALGKPLLWMFGPEFVNAYYLLPIIAVGLLARALVGPIDRLLSMSGHQNVAAAIYGATLAINIALNIALIPVMGLAGAAAATSAAMVLQSIVLVLVAKQRLGITLFGRAVADETPAPVAPTRRKAAAKPRKRKAGTSN